MRTRILALSIAGLIAMPALLIVQPSSAAGPTGRRDTASIATKAVEKKVDKKAKPRYRPDPGLHYNVPRSAPKTQFRIERHVIGAINHTRAGEQIQMAMFSFDRFPVADALIRAKQRGVKVQLILNNHEITPAQRKLRKRLGTKRSRKNFIYQCSKGCRTTGENQHDKFILFSKSGAAENVVMTGSVNMKMNGAKNQYNDLWTVNNAPNLYGTLQKLFGQLKKDKRAKPLYWHAEVGRRYAIDVLPYPGATAKTDPLMRILAPIKCKGAEKPAGNANGRTIIRVNMHAWDGTRGTYIARRFRDLYAAGCDVRLQYGYGGLDVRRVLGQATPRGRVPVRSSGMDTDGDLDIDLYSHMKNLIISGRYGKERSSFLAVTGSSNYQVTGNRGDEILVQIKTRRAFREYNAQWNWMWTKRTRPVRYIQTRSRVNGRVVPSTVIAEPYGLDPRVWEDQ